MRKTLCTLAAGAVMFMAFAINAADDLFKFVPEKANMLIFLKFNELMTHPAFKEAREKDQDVSSKYGDIEARFAKFNIKMENLAGDMLVFREGEDDMGIILKTGITEAKLKEMVASGVFTENQGGKLQEVQVAGRKAFLISSPLNGDEIPSNVSIDNEALLTYLNKDTVLVAEKSCFEKFVAETAKSNVLANKEMMSLKNGINTSSVTAWAVFSMPKPATPAPAAGAAPQPQMMMGNPADSIQGGFVAVSLSGKDKSDIAVDASLKCDNDQSAAMMAMQANGLIMLMSGNICNKNPQLGMQITNAIKIASAGKDLNVKLNFPKTLMDEIKKQMDAMKNQPPAMGCPVPGAAPRGPGAATSDDEDSTIQ